MKSRILFLLALGIGLDAYCADTISVGKFRYAGPVEITMPFQIDTVGTDGKAFDIASVVDASFSIEALRNAPEADSILTGTDAVHLIGFSVENSGFAKVGIVTGGLQKNVIYVDGQKSGPELSLDPGTHRIAIKCFTKADAQCKPDIKVVSKEGAMPVIRTDARRLFSLDNNTQGENCSDISVSAGGKFAAVGHANVNAKGTRNSYTDIVRLSDGVIVETKTGRVSWMPEGDTYYITRPTVTGQDLIEVNPQTGEQKVLAREIPEGMFYIVPGGKYLIYTKQNEAAKEGDVHQILVPDDRQPGWRNRSYLARYDLETGIMQPITFGYHSAWLSDISADGSKIIFQTTRERLTERPTTLSSIWLMDIATLETRCLIQDDGFISRAIFSPKADKLLVTGSPEAFDGVGMVLPEGVIPNQYDYQLFIVDVESGDVEPITKDFNPSVETAAWCRADGKIYFTADDKDLLDIYCYAPDKKEFTALPVSEEYNSHFDVASDAPVLVYSGQSLENGDRAYAINLPMKKQKLTQTLLYDFSAKRLEDVEMGKGDAYEFTSSRGDLINCFYVLPPDFDESKTYPMLVHYYGGCSPTTRYGIGSWSPQYYAAQGYVFLVVNPSGASGFGQEFASRHVNTAGEGVAEDIIEATQRFCQDHPYVDTKKIGCFSASYGGFMTQLLLTKTDMFATGISHAGISDHTSYWGEGYWGYSYSEVSMADSYPWTRKDLYVDRSPLYNADKIHTPLLFLHGSADTNVPIGESIQMFTALKLLGAETAFVVVDGENHGISEYNKRRQWMRTISAWFAKYLKDDASWWDALYPPKTL